MRQGVGVDEGQLDLLAGLHLELFDVVFHLLDDRVDADLGEVGVVGDDAARDDLHLFLLLDVRAADTRIGDEPVVLHGVRGDAGVLDRGVQDGFEERFVAHIVLLVQPQRL